MTALKQKRK